MPGSRWGSKSLIFAMSPIPELPESPYQIKSDIRLPKPKVTGSSPVGIATGKTYFETSTAEWQTIFDFEQKADGPLGLINVRDRW
jgi:hypothetical protein